MIEESKEASKGREKVSRKGKGMEYIPEPKVGEQQPEGR